LFELINISLPRIPNFQGVHRQKFDRSGNYNLGLDSLNIFPEVSYDLTFKNQGCQVTIVFTSDSQEENAEFLSLLNFPFRLS
jgi:ribosomal protein L5